MVKHIDTTLSGKLVGLRTVTTAARADQAEKIFDLDAVTLAMTQAASAGADRVTIIPSPPLDLRDTTAAKLATAELARAGFAVEWVKRQPRPEEPEFWALVVSWRAKG